MEASRLQTLYSSLDPHSVIQHLALHELYPESKEGRKALEDAWHLLSKEQPYSQIALPAESFFQQALPAVVALITKQAEEPLPILSPVELSVIEKLGNRLANRKLRGYSVQNVDQLLALPHDEIDLARGVLLSQLENEHQIRTYEAVLDLMALQIDARLSAQATAPEKIDAINSFIFEEMGFRFPPHSLHVKDIDLYTFLPSVLDGRRGVCLGVSILYICLAQRLALPLEMITPPGHIYVRYRDKTKEINIETTARGIHLDSQEYLNVNTCSLQQRTLKEVIGLSHFNHASVFLAKADYENALKSYIKASLYMPDDSQLMELTAYQYLFTGEIEKGNNLLNQIKNIRSPYTLYHDQLADDYLRRSVDIEGLKVIFQHVDETRSSVLAKKNALEQVLKKYPNFRCGLSALASAWLQLHRHHEALEVLEKYWELEQQDPTAVYYLTLLNLDRLNENKARKYFEQLDAMLQKENHNPKMMKPLRRVFFITA